MAEETTRRARPWGGWIGIGLLTLGLAACGTPQPPSGPAAAGPPAVDDGRVQNTPATPDTGQAAADSGRVPAVAAKDRLPDPATPEVAMAVSANALPGPERLMGLTGVEIKTLLGSPGFVRRDSPAEIWQYGTDACVLDLFLYAQEKDGPHRVSHFEFRGRTVAGITPADCYRQLLAARSRTPAG